MFSNRDKIHFNLFTKCFTWVSLGDANILFVSTAFRIRAFNPDIALNIELSLLNESLKISPEYNFLGTVLQIVIC